MVDEVLPSSPAATLRPRVLAILVLVLVAVVAAVLALVPGPPAIAGASALSGKTVSQIASGANHSCALTSDGTVACWGRNNKGQLGIGSTDSSAHPLAQAITTTGTPLSGKTITQLVAGGDHTCALASDGTFACWGDNTHGQLGDYSTTDRTVATAVDVSNTNSSALYNKTVSQIAAGRDHTCALASDGTLTCWGYNASGQVGDNTSGTDRTVPTAVDVSSGNSSALNGLTVASVRAGGDHTCALTTSALLACWGENGSGQLGDNTTTDRLVPTAVDVTNSNGSALYNLTITSFSLGTSHTCAVTSSGAMACWGDNSDGRIGDGTTTQRSVPTSPQVSASDWPAQANTTVGAVVAADAHTCALTPAGAAYCWGYNGTGQIGDNTTTTQTSPTAVVTASTALAGRTIASVTAGSGSTCAVTSTGVPVCWGDNTYGQIGDGTTTQRNTAVQVITNPTASVSSISGQRSGVTAFGRVGDVLTISGSWWNGSKASTDFTVTIGGQAASTTLSTDANGALTGTVTVPSGATVGAGSLVITQDTEAVTRSFTVLGNRSVSLSPASGQPGTVVTVSGDGFDSEAPLEIVGLKSASGSDTTSDSPVSATASAGGTLASTNFTVGDWRTTYIEVRETSAGGGDPAVDYERTAFTVPPVTVSATAVSGQRAGVTAYGRPGEILTVTGVNWASSLGTGDFTAAFCAVGGGSCDADASSNLTTNGSGDLSGSVTIPSGATTGARALKVTHSGRSALYNFRVMGVRSISLSPASGGLGQPVDITTTDFDPLAAVTIRGITNLTGPTYSTDPAIQGQISASGVLQSYPYIVNDKDTAYIQVSENSPDGDPTTDKAYAAFSPLSASVFINSVTGQRTGVTGYARVGDQVVVGGAGFVVSRASGTITALFCAANGSGCDPAATNSLSTNGSGDLSGSVTVPSGTTTGSRSLKVVVGSGEAFTPLTILGTRTVTITGDVGALGLPITVTASNFDPGAPVQIRSASSVSGATPVYTSDTPISGTITSTGTLTATSYTPFSPGAIVVVETAAGGGDPAVDWAAAPFNSLVPGTTLSLQTYKAASNATNTGVDFGSITSPKQPTPLSGDLNQIQVIDQRYGSFGWSLTATLSNFVGTRVNMSKSVLAITPICTTIGTASAPGATPGGSNQNFATPVTLCTKDTQTGSGDTTSGVYNIDGALTLTVPAFQSSGVYTAIMTVTLA